ncbi:E3 ubiquitin-protein ligase RNF25 [Periplaneta americana]|uniref:E3 ubiquitin-protein ligase RNF25 n=1 Tax=Periplaneta americana TaxID=6978 RepID=UPI0037E938BE
MSNDVDERVVDEVEALKAILMDELIVRTNESGYPEAVETVLFPSTADDALQQYVCLTLVVELPPGYPDVPPVTSLRNPRGLDDSVLGRIERETKEKCESYRGQAVIYELIELVKEYLTASNLPSCQCAICLYGFREGDHFTKTQCYHYFHSHCLACHVTSSEKSYQEELDKLPAWQRNQQPQSPCQVLCPVCREPIQCDMALLSTAAPPLDVENARQFELSDELRSLQRQMAALFSHQKSRGGIIDPEAEESKLLLVTETPEPEGDDDPPGPSLLLPPPASHGFPQHNSMGTSMPSRGDWRRGGRGGFRGRGSSSSHRNKHGRRHHQAAATSR